MKKSLALPTGKGQTLSRGLVGLKKKLRTSARSQGLEFVKKYLSLRREKPSKPGGKRRPTHYGLEEGKERKKQVER